MTLATLKNIVVEKRPISILLVSMLGISFIASLMSASVFNKGSLAIITYFPIFIIIPFVLIFVNLGKNKTRTNGFIIATCSMIVILAISSYSYHYGLSNKGTTNSTGNQAIGEIQGVGGDNVTETSNEEPKNSESQKASKEKTNNEIAKAIVLTGRGNQS